MTTHSNYSLQNFSTNNAKVLTGNSQPVPDFKLGSPLFKPKKHVGFSQWLQKIIDLNHKIYSLNQ